MVCWQYLLHAMRITIVHNRMSFTIVNKWVSFGTSDSSCQQFEAMSYHVQQWRWQWERYFPKIILKFYCLIDCADFFFNPILFMKIIILEGTCVCFVFYIWLNCSLDESLGLEQHMEFIHNPFWSLIVLWKNLLQRDN